MSSSWIRINVTEKDRGACPRLFFVVIFRLAGANLGGKAFVVSDRNRGKRGLETLLSHNGHMLQPDYFVPKSEVQM